MYIAQVHLFTVRVNSHTHTITTYYKKQNVKKPFAMSRNVNGREKRWNGWREIERRREKERVSGRVRESESE